MKKTGKPKHNLVFYLFLFPSVFAFFMIIIIPFLMGMYYSLTDWTAITGATVEWVGLKNFIAIMDDVTFLNAFMITTVYAILSIFVLNVVAFFLALLVTGKISHTGVFRAGFFLPNLIGGLILGYIWQFIFNSAIPAFGGMIGFTWLKEHVFIADRYLALLAIIIVGTWQYGGYIMMIYVASLQAIPASMTEAASIDGANYGQRLRYIIFPLVAPAFTVSMFLTFINSFKQFDVNFALTAGGPAGMFLGKPVMTNQFLALNIYQTAFSYQRLAEAQAKAVIFFVVITVISLIQVRHNKRREVEM
ncbi:MAG: sugar ABC transporter permease [Treponema sp.]|jgi:raffinose/stachyose/melibiose transport system permease protein|nr:sugar ABC transporter permease [Treponema sp.]